MKHSFTTAAFAGLMIAALTTLAGAVPTLITGMETDTSTGGFPFGADGEWTRFGAAYNGITLDTTPANASAGNNSINTAADWSAGAFYGIRYNVAGASLDVTAGPTISFMAKYDGVGTPQVSFITSEIDGDVWVSTAPFALTTSYQKYTLDLATGLTNADATGGADLDNNAIQYIGFDLRANGAVSGTPVFTFDEIYYNDPITSVQDWNLF